MSYSESIRSRIVAVAQKMLTEEMGIVEGCRSLLQLQASLREPNDKLFETIVAVESETEDLPLGKLRSRWSKESLAKKDAEVSAYISQVRELVLEACETLVKEYSTSRTTQPNGIPDSA